MNIVRLEETHHLTTYCRFCFTLSSNVKLFRILCKVSKFSFTKNVRSAVVINYLNFVSHTCLSSGFYALQGSANAKFVTSNFLFFLYVLLEISFGAGLHTFLTTSPVKSAL